MRVNLNSTTRKNTKLGFVVSLVDQFSAYNDVKPGKVLSEYLNTPVGAKTFADWAKSAGYKIEYWCFEPYETKVYDDSKYPTIIKTWVGFGLDIDESCEKIVELKLKLTGD